MDWFLKRRSYLIAWPNISSSYKIDEVRTFHVIIKDGNGPGSNRVEYLGTQNRNPNLKPEPAPNTVSGENSSPKPKPADIRNPTNNLKPELFFHKPAQIV